MSVKDKLGSQGPEVEAVQDSRPALIEAGMLLASELSLPILLRRLVEIAVKITGARYGALGVLGTQGEISEFITVGLSEQERAAIGPLPTGRGVLGALIHDPQPLSLTRLQDDHRSVGWPLGHPPMTTFLGTPVNARGQVFGNLYLTEKEGGQPFDADDQAAAVTLATQAGVAIANAQTHQDLLQREHWLAALHEITTGILAAEPEPDLMTTIVRSARELAGADLAAIALPLDEGSAALRVVAADGVGSETILRAPAKTSGTVSHLVFGTGRAQTAMGVHGEFESSLVAGAGVPIGALMVVPLLTGGRVTGTISLTLAETGAEFSPGTLSLLESFAGQASLALDYARVQAQSLRVAVVEERIRIARDLHDEPVQALIYLARRLEGMAIESSNGGTSVAKLGETRELAVAVVDGLRQLTEGLRSEILDLKGLAPALGDLVGRFDSRTGIPATFSIRGNPSRWDAELERNLFRLTQEALSNIERHAGAGRVRLDLIVRAGGLTIRVADDGVGFISSGEGAVTRGFGTIGMQERAALQGGRLRIRSRPGRGTVLVATVPAPQLAIEGGNHPEGDR
jgi:signal transduction histidine kinase